MNKQWNPFNPEWYNDAFDKYINNGEYLFNQKSIIEQGYDIPDADGSRSSAFRNNAVLNNTFSEQDLRDTLKDIYMNSTKKLIASSHDNTHFFQWAGNMSDMKIIPNTDMCEFYIPTEAFIGPTERDAFKMSQFYRKWIKVEDILNNWNIFKWHCMLFINQRIYSEYELRIDDHQVCIKFKYYDYWMRNNFPVYIYRFDTSASCRMLISSYQCNKEWDWKMPVSVITDQRVTNSEHVMVAFNKISDQEIRKDGLAKIDVLGDNIEFLSISNGYIDLTGISDFNKIYINSESREWLWMSIIVPKFFNEYPLLLPTESTYRPYIPDMQPVSIISNNKIQNVKTNVDDSDTNKQVVIDMSGYIADDISTWKTMIRPIVLTDAFDNPYEENVNDILLIANNLRDLTVEGADRLEDFRFFLHEYTSDSIFNKHLDNINVIMKSIRDVYHKFMDIMYIEYDPEYESIYAELDTILVQIRSYNMNSEWLTSPDGTEENFFFHISPLIHIPRSLADKYNVYNIIEGMGDRRNLWDNVDKYKGKLRFQRPIDESDFWTFEFYDDGHVWRPYPLKFTRHFPDVYIPVDTTDKTPRLDRVFKAFFFYSDTINVLDQDTDIRRATPSWDNDIAEYNFDRRGNYRNVYMEKFYWMAVKSIYRGSLRTNSRWEVLEHVIDNDSYNRFNELFLNTVDPYIKLGIATYLRSPNFEFPFDDAISKMKESIGTKWLGYQQVTNYEAYLNKNCRPSYFDTIIDISDTWRYGDRLLRRPRSTFDIARLLPVMRSVHDYISDITSTPIEILDYVLEKLSVETYRLDVDQISNLRNIISDAINSIDDAITLANDLDKEIYSINDVNNIINKFDSYTKLIDESRELFTLIGKDVYDQRCIDAKLAIYKITRVTIYDIPKYIEIIGSLTVSSDIDELMKILNDLDPYFQYPKHSDDSLMGEINKFNDPWSKRVKESRDTLFVKSSTMYGLFDTNKSYTDEEISNFVNSIHGTIAALRDVQKVLEDYWKEYDIEEKEVIINKIELCDNKLSQFASDITNCVKRRSELVEEIDRINSSFWMLDKAGASNTELGYRSEIEKYMGVIINDLSYIAGFNKIEEANDIYHKIDDVMNKWSEFLKIEDHVFFWLTDLTNNPVELLEDLDTQRDIIGDIRDFMDTVNVEYVPDSSIPTYSDVYWVDNIEIVTGGFKHTVGDTVFVPSLGSYTIETVEGNSCTATQLTISDHTKTTFRDPMVQSRPYDTITSGNGMGITIKPLSSNRMRIINDTCVIPYIQLSQKILVMITSDKDAINPQNNENFTKALRNIERMKSDWNTLIDTYGEYMSDESKNYISNLINSLYEMTEMITSFIDIRSRIDLVSLSSKYDIFVNTDIKNIDMSTIVNSDHYVELLKISYTDLLEFYDTGNWNDEKELTVVLSGLKNSIRVFNSNVLSQVSGTDDAELLYDDIVSSIDGIISAIGELHPLVIDITSKCGYVNTLIANITNDMIQLDEWYSIDAIISIEGSGYKHGDIASISSGKEVLLFQVIGTNDGKVSKIRPLIEYALHNSVNGTYDTVTESGEGNGLMITIKSSKIKLSDSTLFLDDVSDTRMPNQFDDNDMFMFKFENIHDLDIGYEVYLSGKQITDFAHRHISDGDPLHPKDFDVIYLYANDVINVRNTSIFIPSKHYFNYHIDKIDIVDSGAGYYKGQEIFVDADKITLKLRVTELTEDPLKGIAAVELVDATSSDGVVDISCDNAKVAPDSMNNIDDEYNNGYYDKITDDCIRKPATFKYPENRFSYTSCRYDDLVDGDRNKSFMHPEILNDDKYPNGDPDGKWYLGSRVDYTDIDGYRQGMINTVPPTHEFIDFVNRYPVNQNPSNEFQSLARLRIHKSVGETNNDPTKKFDQSLNNRCMITGDISVPDFVSIPTSTDDWSGAHVGSSVIVEHDETNGGHRMLYRIRTFVAYGFFVYDLPEIADIEWDSFNINFMNIDSYPDHPSQNAQYENAPWHETTHQKVVEGITDGKYTNFYPVKAYNKSTYIHNITLDDLSVFNWTTNEWEDLHDVRRWKFETFDYGFKLIMISDDRSTSYIVKEVSRDTVENGWYDSDDVPAQPNELHKDTVTENWDNDGKGDTTADEHEIPKPTVDEDWKNNGYDPDYREPEEFTYVNTVKSNKKTYSYDMELFLNKSSSSQIRNEKLKRDAIFNIKAGIGSEVNKKSINRFISTGRHLRIRKLFPFEQKESYTVGGSYGNEMDFKINNYIHYKNEIHMEDIAIYNKTVKRFENIMDPNMFELRLRDDRAVSKGYETQTNIMSVSIIDQGESFVNGMAWAWNEEYKIHVFGYVESDFYGTGSITSFTPLHCINAASSDISLEFVVYQNNQQSESQKAIVIMDFVTQKVEVNGDGYIHNVQNRLAPITKEFKLIVKYELDVPCDYDIMISKSPRVYTFVEPKMMVTPTFDIPDHYIPSDRIYISNDNGRFPLVNPSTGKPSFVVSHGDKGTTVKFLNIYKAYEKIQIHVLPYPIRSVYTQRNIPEHGFIDIDGKLNKPLSKKYYEFWVNGKLLHDEVTIVSPTKLLMHGLQSLKNFEIIEVNRDPNEYFSDQFLEVEQGVVGRPYYSWNLRTYLDDALEGNLDGDNYTPDEQATLLYPVWPQVDDNDPEFKNYPPNVDVEDDIISRGNNGNAKDPNFQYMTSDGPTLEGHSFTDVGMEFEDFGFTPISDEMLINMMNDEWSEEIRNNRYFPSHNVSTEDEWYCVATRLYDKYGNEVTNINEAAYSISDQNYLKINTASKTSRIIHNEINYDLK